LKTLFINKYDTLGGAAKAAFRLNLGLRKYLNYDNHFLVGIKVSNLDYVYVSRKSGFENFVERGINFATNLIGFQYKWFPFSTNRIISVVREFKPDIISLHNIHGGYFKTSLIKELSKYAPVVWTLHDMWAFTANAAYTLGDDSWKSLKAGPHEKDYFPQIGINTGSWLLKSKKLIYENSNLTIVCPSKWLYGLAKQSPVFTNNSIHSIANGIDLELFRPHNKNEVRNQLNIPIDAKVISFVAEKIYQSQFKGGKNLISILKGINENATEKIHVIMIGEGSDNELLNLKNLVIHSTGYVNSDGLISKYLSASDIFIFPTLADNLPNTLIEACACGVPCVTFDIGGCGEIVENDFNGLLIKPFDVQKFVEKTLDLLENSEKQKVFSQNCLIKVSNEYSIQKMSRKYDELFQELLNV